MHSNFIYSILIKLVCDVVVDVDGVRVCLELFIFIWCKSTVFVGT